MVFSATEKYDLGDLSSRIGGEQDNFAATIMTRVSAYGRNLLHRFRSEQDGFALTEYMILLGLLVGGVVVAVLLFATSVSDVWGTWTTWFLTVPVPPV